MEILGYQMPEELHYEKHHYWVRAEGDLLVMGMDDFAQELAGDIVYVKIPFAGKKLKADKKFAQVESGKWLGKIYAPLDGELIEGNEALEADPSLINQDCYGTGWMYKIKPVDMGDMKNLIHGVEAITEWLAVDIKQYKED